MRLVQKEPPRPGIRFTTDKNGPERVFIDKNESERANKSRATIYYGEEQDQGIQFIMDNKLPERVAKKEPPRPGVTICYR